MITAAGILKDKGAEVTTLASSSSLADAVGVLRKQRIGALVVLAADNQLAGLLSERDIVMALARMGAAALKEPVERVMLKDFAFCALEDGLDKIMGIMTGRRQRHVPVVEDGQLAGIISIGDAVKCRIAETEREASALRDYIATG